MVEARYYQPGPGGTVECVLCPHHCQVAEGRRGVCAVRLNQGGKLYSLVYGRPAALNIDPVEKKPLFHFLPGSRLLSLGTVGCNLRCRFCQNSSLSRGRLDPADAVEWPPERVVETAKAHGCAGLAYTYNEPTVFAEYAQDIAALAKEAGLRNAFVTNGYIDPQALPSVYADIDAANVDLKAFSAGFYHDLTRSSLQPVLDTLVALRRLGVWVEITNLVIPTLNDAENQIGALCRWVLDHLGDRTPVHFTAFHPDHQLLDIPPTPHRTLVHARELALNLGMKYVYLGNVRDEEGSSTRCPECGSLLVQRSWHAVRAVQIAAGRCPRCHAPVDFILPPPASR